MKKIEIGKKIIGEGEPVFIIAEAGVNHNGNVQIAKKLIKKASEANADAVKFQTFFAENIVSKTASKARYQLETTQEGESQYEMLKRLELSKEDHYKLIRYAKRRKIVFLSTPFDEESADFLEELGVPAYKISSGDLTNLPLLNYIANKKLPMIVSTGMSDLSEVKEAVNIIRKTGNEDLILLHCTSDYPTKIEDVNLKAMQTLKKTFRTLVGYSDHTLGLMVPIMAATLGAVVIEKHFTLDKNMPGPDHKVSLDPIELRKMIENIRTVEKILGLPIKQPVPSEREMRKVVRRSIVATTDIPEGVKITKDMVALKRPGTGLPSKYLKSVIGSLAKIKIKRDEIITFNKISKE